MSLIGRLGENYKNLPDILAEYELILADAEGHILTKGKTLGNANAEHASWQYYYDSRMADLSMLVKYFQGQVDATRGRLFKKMTSATSLELSDRQREKFIDNDEQYLEKYEVYLEVLGLYEKYKAASEAFKSRGYALMNITKARVADVEHGEI